MNQQDAQGRQLFDATCSKCGVAIQVPFQPSGDRPVFCAEHYRDARGTRTFSDRGGGDRQMYDAVCATCGQPTQVPFRPMEGRPVYCREHFRGSRR